MYPVCLVRSNTCLPAVRLKVIFCYEYHQLLLLRVGTGRQGAALYTALARERHQLRQHVLHLGPVPRPEFRAPGGGGGHSTHGLRRPLARARVRVLVQRREELGVVHHHPNARARPQRHDEFEEDYAEGVAVRLLRILPRLGVLMRPVEWGEVVGERLVLEPIPWREQ